MKKVLSVVVMLLMMIGCSEELAPKRLSSSEQAELAARDNAQTMIAIQEALDVTAGAMEDKGVAEGRVKQGGSHDNYGCAPSINLTLNVDRTKADSLIYSGTIIINYGDGNSCSSTDKRTGKITDAFKISISTKNKIAFIAKETITFDNFNKENSSFDGVFTVTSANGKKTTVNSTGMTVGYTDGTTSSWKGNLVFSYEDVLKRKGELRIAGNISGTSRQGMPFTATITQDLVFKGGCLGLTKQIPVSGKVAVQTNGTGSIVDYGDGSCDKNYSVTVDGEAETYTFG
ncbi:MAG: hypothetical protein WDO15_17915 [Bacteroidota bacterium]